MIFGNLYFTDLLDIVIIALFIYSIFILFQRTRTYLIFLGLSFIVSLYLLAKNFNLFLTSLVLQYFVGVSVLIFVIIFQSEIRKYFELLGLIGTRQIKVGKLAPKSPSTAEIVQACVKLAQDKVGALIVLRGQDRLDDLIEGGVTVDAVISEELILSIFDPHSEGHDGAMIIDNNRISRLSVHLPLSNNFRELGRFGTRHSAALGLSEQSDALCIVVSEERGKISLCKEGKLKTLEDFSDLEKDLDRFIKSRFHYQPDGFIKAVLTHNLGLKSLAGASAVVLWFFSAYQAAIIRKDYSVPLTFINLPKEVLVENYSPKEITLTVSGRGETAFSNISAMNFKVNIDAAAFHDGVNQIALSRKNLDVPINLFLVSSHPDSVLLTAKKYTSRPVSVSVKTSGAPAPGWKLTTITVTPTSVDLWVPAAATVPAEVFTESISIAGLKESLILPAKLLLPPDSKLLKGDPEVNVALTIAK